MFEDRIQAGEILASEIPKDFIGPRTQVVAIAISGIPVGCSVAKKLNLPIDLIFSKKIPLVERPHLAVGAVTSDETYILDERILKNACLLKNQVEHYKQEAIEKIKNQMEEIRGSYIPPIVSRKTVIVVDDGISTGITMLSVIKCLKKNGASKIVVAVPVSSFAGYKKVSAECDDFIALRICSDTQFSIPSFYEEQAVDSAEAIQCFKNTRKRETARSC